VSFLNVSLQAFNLEENKVAVLIALFLGVVFHWVYEVAVAATKAGTWDFGNTGQIAARLVISAVVSLAGLVAAYSQVQKADPGFRLVSAFVAGLSVDALTAPWLAKT
jgi:hypothetical protein